MALVQPRPRRLGQRRVGGFADRARGGSAAHAVARRRGRAGRARRAASQRLLELGARDAGGERVHRRGANASPATAPSASAERSAVSRRSRRAASSAWSAGGSASRRPPLADVGDELLEEERVAARRLGDPPSLVGLEAPAADRRRAASPLAAAESGPSVEASTRAHRRPAPRAGRGARPQTSSDGRVAQPRGRRRAAGRAAPARPSGRRRRRRRAARARERADQRAGTPSAVSSPALPGREPDGARPPGARPTARGRAPPPARRASGRPAPARRSRAAAST